MKNPYDILGVPQGAPIEQVKAAYKELVRKYDAHGDGSSSDQRKLDEINNAYDSIVMGGSYAGESSGWSEPQGSYYTGGADFSDIRARIKAGRFDDAEVLLDGMPDFSRNAEWYYLKGTVQHSRGWLEEAAKNFEAACNMDPSNQTYRAACNNVNNARAGGYRTERRRNQGGSANRGCCDCDFCDVCSGLICADCCCESMGGDLIPCC